VRTDEFWSVVDRARSGEDPAAVVEAVVVQLAARPAPEIAGFDRHLRRVLDASYREDLWGAAYLINGGCSDDGFDYFRGWLLAQGHAIWQMALADPDSLADHPEIRGPRSDQEPVYLQCEDILGVAYRAYEALTGQELTVEVAGLYPRRPELGEDWDFDNAAEMRTRYRRLWALCGWEEASSAPS
jgi:Protein of unknown function (DUF4240)